MKTCFKIPLFLILLLQSFSVMSYYKYSFCLGKDTDGTNFCSELKDGKTDLGYCKLWAESRNLDTSKIEVKTTIPTDQDFPTYHASEFQLSFCDRKDIYPNYPYGARDFYVGCSDKKVVKFNLSAESFEKHIVIDIFSIGELTCRRKDGKINFILWGTDMSGSVTFKLNKSSVYYPINHDDFKVEVNESGHQCFALSPQQYQNLCQYNGSIYPNNVPEIDLKYIFNNSWEEVESEDFICTYGIMAIDYM